MTEPVTRPAREADAAAIAELHAACISEGFLASLGAGFLRRLYRRVVRSRDAFALVVGGDGAVDAFVAVALDTRRLYREFLLRDGIGAAAAAARGIVRRPRHVFETFRYGTRGQQPHGPAAEILAIAVAPRARGHKLGAALARAALAEASSRGASSVRVVTALGNASAAHTYAAAGMHPEGFDEVHRGVTQQVMVWP